MRAVLIVLVLAVETVFGASIVKPFVKYHEEVGIPRLARIRQREGALDFDGGRIAGGIAVDAGAQPHLAGIIISLVDGGTSTCSASLVTNQHSVTAAHCWADGWRPARSFELVFGSARLLTGGVRVRSDRVAVHEHWDTDSFRNDIAVVTHDWIQYSNVINRILLPSGPELDQDFAGVFAQVAGFGLTQPGAESAYQYKRQATLQVITNDACRQVFGGAVAASTLCTSGTDGANICEGDTGGPLAVGSGSTRVLIGVSSFTSMQCDMGLPAAYARVTHYWAWIVTRITANEQI